MDKKLCVTTCVSLEDFRPQPSGFASIACRLRRLSLDLFSLDASDRARTRAGASKLVLVKGRKPPRSSSPKRRLVNTRRCSRPIVTSAPRTSYESAYSYPL